MHRAGGCLKNSSSVRAVIISALLLRKREGGIREAAAAAVQGAEVERSVQLSCGEHTDYGLLTLVNQDPHVSALQVSCCYRYIHHLRILCDACADCALLVLPVAAAVSVPTSEPSAVKL